jgi:hypothetical protein
MDSRLLPVLALLGAAAANAARSFGSRSFGGGLGKQVKPPAPKSQLRPFTPAYLRFIGQSWNRALMFWGQGVDISPATSWVKTEDWKGSDPIAYIELRSRQVWVNYAVLESDQMIKSLTAVFAHEIGHHVRWPGTLKNQARQELLQRDILPHYKEDLTNLFQDLLINQHIGESFGLKKEVCSIYRAMRPDLKAFRQLRALKDKGFKVELREVDGKKISVVIDPEGNVVGKINDADAEGASSDIWTFYLGCYEAAFGLQFGELSGPAAVRKIAKRHPNWQRDATQFVRAFFYGMTDVYDQFYLFCKTIEKYIEPPKQQKQAKIIIVMGGQPGNGKGAGKGAGKGKGKGKGGGDGEGEGEGQPGGGKGKGAGKGRGGGEPGEGPGGEGETIVVVVEAGGDKGPLSNDRPDPDIEDYVDVILERSTGADKAAERIRARARGKMGDESKSQGQKGGHMSPTDSIEADVAKFEPDERKPLLKEVYRRLVDRYLFEAPRRRLPPDADIPTSHEIINPGDDLESIDWLTTLSKVGDPRLSAIEAYRRTYEPDTSIRPGRKVSDIEIYLDTSGSMPNPMVAINTLTIAALVLAVAAVRAGARVRGILWSHKMKATPWMSSEAEVFDGLLDYVDGGTAFPFNYARKSGEERKGDPPIRVVVTDNGFLYNVDELVNPSPYRGAPSHGTLDDFRGVIQKSDLFIVLAWLPGYGDESEDFVYDFTTMGALALEMPSKVKLLRVKELARKSVDDSDPDLGEAATILAKALYSSASGNRRPPVRQLRRCR